MMQAVILAGGKGTRLASLLNGKPKCLVDIDGVPLLERQIAQLKRYGVDDVVILVNHAADQVRAFLDANASFGIGTRLIDDGLPRGTAGAVLQAIDSLAPQFLVIYSDTLFDIDLGRFLATHRASAADATLFVHPNDHPADSDLVEVDEAGAVVAFHPYPHPDGRDFANQVNAALYVIEKAALERWRDFRSPADFGKDLFPAMLAASQRLQGYPSFEYLKDVGTPKRLAKAEAALRSGVVERATLRHRQKAVFVDRDGTLNFHRGFIKRTEDLEVIPGVAEAIARLNHAEYRVVLVTNQPVIARGDCTTAEVRRMHDKLETALGGVGAFLDAIYLCPHHPDGGFPGEVAALKFACDCRKPRLGMIERAVTAMNIDLHRSWMIGDTTLDIELARRAGTRSILVQTGMAGVDGKYQATPDHVVADFPTAVDRLLMLDGTTQ